MSPRVQLVGILRCSGAPAGRVPPVRLAWRGFATHSDRVPPSGSSSSSQNATTDSTAELLRRLEAESRKQGGASGFGGRDSVGPFPLGVGPSGRKKVWRPWGELGVRGKSEYRVFSCCGERELIGSQCGGQHSRLGISLSLL